MRDRPDLVAVLLAWLDRRGDRGLRVIFTPGTVSVCTAQPDRTTQLLLVKIAS